MTVSLELEPGQDVRVKLTLTHGLGLPPEFRRRVVADLVTIGVPVRQIARRLGTPRRTVRDDVAWLDQHLEEVL